jgi:hypothetical protein
MDIELLVQAHLAELHRLAESCGRMQAARRATRANARPGRLGRLGLRVLDGFAWATPPITEHADPWYPLWWDG